MTYKVSTACKDEAGNVSIMMALLIVPLLLIVGISIDYANEVNQKLRLDASMDTAILAGVKRAAEVDQAGQKDWSEQATKTAIELFRHNAGKDANVSNLIFNPSFAKSDKVYTGTASYSADVATYMMGIFGTRVVPIGSTAKAQTSTGNFLHIHFVIDNSASMGIGAEEADWIKMRAVTPSQCAFACHQMAAFSPAIAHAATARLRIDVVRDAMINVVKSIKQRVGEDGSVKVTIHTFSNTLVSGAGSSNLDQVTASLIALDLVSGSGGGTYIDHSLKSLNAILPQAGTGVSAADPKGYIVIFSDGLEDSPLYQMTGKGVHPPGATWVYNSGAGYETMGDNTVMQSFNPTLCAAFKAKKYEVFAAQIKYVKSDYLYRRDSNGKANANDANKVDRITRILAPRVEAAFKACVTSPKYAVLATKSSEIEPKLQAIVDAITLSKISALTQ